MNLNHTKPILTFIFCRSRSHHQRNRSLHSQTHNHLIPKLHRGLRSDYPISRLSQKNRDPRRKEASRRETEYNGCSSRETLQCHTVFIRVCAPKSKREKGCSTGYTTCMRILSTLTRRALERESENPLPTLYYYSFPARGTLFLFELIPAAYTTYGQAHPISFPVGDTPLANH